MSAGMIRDFDSKAYGAAGFGQQDVDELKRRGHSYDEINDYVQGQRASKGSQFGSGAATYLQSEGRKKREKEMKQREARDRAQQQLSKHQVNYNQDFTGGAGNVQKSFTSFNPASMNQQHRFGRR